MAIFKSLSIGREISGCQAWRRRVVWFMQRPPEGWRYMSPAIICILVRRQRHAGGGSRHLLHSTQLIIQIGRLTFVVVLRADLLDLSLGQTQLRLAEFNDRAQAQPVPPFRQIESLRGLVQQLLGEGKPLVGGNDVEPASPDVLGDAVLEVAKKLFLRASPRRRFGVFGIEESSVKKGDIDVETCCRVTARQRFLPVGR